MSLAFVPWTGASASPSVLTPTFRLRSKEKSESAEGAPRSRPAAVLTAILACGLHYGKRVKRRNVQCQANVTGPGWTDELARIFDPREEGPSWQPDFGYSGRSRLRLLLDAEDISHSFAQARYEQTGRWTGPLSEGIVKALEYGAWGGGEPEEVNPHRQPHEPDMTPPEILTFVGMPADMIEAVKPGNVVDGYPEQVREEIGHVVLSEDGFFINGLLQSLQEDNRLLTWKRPNRLRDGTPRPSPLIVQKNYKPGGRASVGFKNLAARPVLLVQTMGAENLLKVGDVVEALKPGRFFKETWIPSMWKRASVAAVNYDGTYDIQFEMNHGPYRERRTKGHKRTPTLSLRKNEQFKEYAADHMPASFRLFQEMNYQLSVPPKNIRMPGVMEPIAHLRDTEATQDWYLCTNKEFIMGSSKNGRDSERLAQFSRRFLLSYRWVPTASGDLRFEPVPNATQAQALRACHKDTALQFANAAQIDDDSRRKIKKYKKEMQEFEKIIGDLKARPHKPKRPAGPRVNGVNGVNGERTGRPHKPTRPAGPRVNVS